MKKFIAAPIFLIWALFSCAQESQPEAIIHFPDIEDGKVMICTDDVDGFFENISLADMSIQLKNNDFDNEDYIGASVDYFRLLQSEVIAFSDREKKRLNQMMRRAERAVISINPDIFPDSINMIKIQGNAYGNSAFFTRENSIYIPGGMIQAMNDEQLYHVMLHEIFHIMSRYDQSLREEMYKVVHYSKVTDSICLPESTKQRLLLNPDGVDHRYSIDLAMKTGEVMRVIPLILSTDTLFNSKKGQFFNHLRFGLFPLVEKNESCQTLVVDARGYSPLPNDVMQTYQDKVGDITRYNIHPDELMADHFAIAIEAHERGDFSAHSERGQQALQRTISILKEN